jgi:hypothetical protein
VDAGEASTPLGVLNISEDLLEASTPTVGYGGYKGGVCFALLCGWRVDE